MNAGPCAGGEEIAEDAPMGDDAGNQRDEHHQRGDRGEPPPPGDKGKWSSKWSR